jgi:hypothetical protein
VEKRARIDEVRTLTHTMSELRDQITEAQRINTKMSAHFASREIELQHQEESIIRAKEEYQFKLKLENTEIQCNDEAASKRLQDLADQEKSILMRTANAEYLNFENELLLLEMKEIAFEQFKQTKRHVRWNQYAL